MISRLHVALIATIATSVVPALALAQDTPAAVPTPEPSASPEVPPIVRPTSTPTPIATPTLTPPPIATPTSTPAPLPAPSADPGTAVLPAPVSVRATPTPRRTITVAPAPTPSALSTSRAVPAPVASPSAHAPAIIAPLPTDSGRNGARPLWPWALGAAVIALGGIGLWLARRRPDAAEEAAQATADEPVPASPPPASPSCPWLTLSFRPTQVGFNMLSATVDGVLTVANDGDAAAEDVRVRAVLLGAHVGQDAEIAAFLAEPIGRPAAPPFALQQGERRTVRVIAAVPRTGLRTMTAAGRPMFVPILAINVLTTHGQVAQVFAVGAERVDSAKLAPFWLDVPDRVYAEVAARPHGSAVERQSKG